MKSESLYIGSQRPYPLRWGTLSAITAGIMLLVAVLLILIVLPATGSSSDHAMHPEQFLPWMAEKGGVRVLVWWIVAIPFFVAALGIPDVLKQITFEDAPLLSQLAAKVATIGLLVCAFSSLALAAGERPLAQSYVTAQDQGLFELQQSLIAFYTWQRLVIALLFDFLGFFLVGLWVMGSSLTGLKTANLPRTFCLFGVVTGLLCWSFAFGYVLQISWLGEFGLGGLAFIALPVWLFWLGICLHRGAAKWG